MLRRSYYLQSAYPAAFLPPSDPIMRPDSLLRLIGTIYILLYSLTYILALL